MKRRTNVLAAALAAGAMVAGMVPAQGAPSKETQPAVVTNDRRRRRRRQAEKRPTTWKEAREKRLEELRQREAWGTLTWDAEREIRQLEYEVRYSREVASRGRPARRMTRRRRSFAERLVKSGGVIGRDRRDRPAPLRVDQMSRTQRRQLMRELGVPATGRQWRKLRKADRRQERLA